MSQLSLGQLLQAHGDWTELSASDLSNALKNSSLKASDLNEFITSAKDWWLDDAATEVQRRARHDWLETVGDEFIRGIREDGITAIARDLDELDARLSFLANLAGHDVGRHLLRGAVAEVAQLLRRSVPTERPDRDGVSPWTERIVRLVEISGVSSRLEGLTQVIDALPEWLFEALMRSVGRLRYYDNYYRELANALCGSDNDAIPRVLARMAASSRTSRQTELISLIARATRDPQRGAASPNVPSSESARRLMTRVESGAPSEKKEEVYAILDSYRHYDREVSSILFVKRH